MSASCRRLPIVMENNGAFSVQIAKGTRLIWWDAGDMMTVRIECADDAEFMLDDQVLRRAAGPPQ
jgi:hypothetical protein